MERILVVDDNKQNIYMAEILFAGNGFEVETASNGKEALEKARANPPDLLISDILMPVMDGFALCREWRKDENLKNIPFVFYTATYTEPEDEQFALSLGADRFLKKPLDTVELIRITKELMNKKETGSYPDKEQEPPQEEVYLRLYNQALVHKLEDKLFQLEEANKRLEYEIKERQYAEQRLYSYEKQIAQSQKMEALGSLAGGIAHDFNNILMAIMAHAELAILDSSENIPNSKNIEQIQVACNRAKELINQILTFSRQASVEKRPIKISTIAQEVLKLIKSSLPPGIEIKQKIESESPVMANPTQIYQVLINLCTNASHAIKKKEGIIEVRLSDCIIDNPAESALKGLVPGKYQKLEVIDNGRGIKADDLDEIFSPYFTTRKNEGGTGLGLSVVQNIVKNSGGRITVKSTYGQGATFSLFFPVCQDGVEKALYDSAIIKTENEHILFIDDETTFMEMAVEMLEKLGYRVTAFSESMAALKAFKARPMEFDLVLSDIEMPFMSGLELVNELHTIHNDIPVVLCTGFSDRITEKRTEELKIKGFLMKPFILSDLSKAIRKALGKPDGHIK
ncbi:MAG: response regulator [Deltaproteobacteria bacterium]|nr:response regulator [Deltaproteobacteria bacterium]